jgi:hypothetical protein
MQIWVDADALRAEPQVKSGRYVKANKKRSVYNWQESFQRFITKRGNFENENLG